MRVHLPRHACALLAAVVVAAGCVVVGRLTADTHGDDAGQRAAATDAYFRGLLAGEAQGREEGRALQEGSNLPAGDRRPVHDAFEAAYAAGSNDAFAGYDGGWSLSTPYVVTIEEGSGKIVYRIASREPVKAGVDYYLCSDGHSLCQRSHR
jgi:hypothetical protein